MIWLIKQDKETRACKEAKWNYTNVANDKADANDKIPALLKGLKFK
jgi:hypothetical protein